MPEITITIPGVLKLLFEINQCKASGPDNIPALVLKETASVIAPPISTVLKVVTGYPLNNFVGAKVNGFKGSLDGFALNELVIKHVQNSLKMNLYRC